MFKDTISGIFPYLMPLFVGLSFAEGGVGEGEGNEGVPDLETMAIPENYKDTPVGKYKTVGEAFKGYDEAQKLIGAKGVIVPGENAKPEEQEKFYNTLGRPEKSDGYKLTPIENLHPNLKMTPESEASFKGLMHKHGLSTKQADGFHKDFFSAMSTALTKKDEESDATKHETEKALRAEWGAEYDNNLGKSKRLIEKYGGANAREAFGELGNNPQVLKTIANIAKKFSEDGFIKGDKVTNVEMGDARKKISEIQLNLEHPFHKKGLGHDEAVEEMKRLHQIAYPEIEV